MVFDKNSGHVSVWVFVVKNGKKIDEVPKLFNLREVVLSVLKEEGVEIDA